MILLGASAPKELLSSCPCRASPFSLPHPHFPLSSTSRGPTLPTCLSLGSQRPGLYSADSPSLCPTSFSGQLAGAEESSPQGDGGGTNSICHPPKTPSALPTSYRPSHICNGSRSCPHWQPPPCLAQSLCDPGQSSWLCTKPLCPCLPPYLENSEKHRHRFYARLERQRRDKRCCLSKRGGGSSCLTLFSFPESLARLSQSLVQTSTASNSSWSILV